MSLRTRAGICPLGRPPQRTRAIMQYGVTVLEPVEAEGSLTGIGLRGRDVVLETKAGKQGTHLR